MIDRTPAPAAPRVRQQGLCQVELYGPARLAAGVKQVSLPIGGEVSLHDLLQALARVCPALVGPVVDPDGQTLMDGYVCNLNGRNFLSHRDAAIRPGDRLLLLASGAGG